MDIIHKYLPKLSDHQIEQFAALQALYVEWNSKINVISRKDIDNLYERHVLHSLAISHLTHFLPNAKILDLGTGGGFPGIPLAILFPKTRFTLVDGTRKKIRVVEEVSQAIGLKNVDVRHTRAEEIKKEYFDFVVSRAVAKLDKLMAWSRPLLDREERHGLPNGLICLKGGNIEAEIAEFPNREYVETYPISGFFEEAFFEEKYVVYVQK